MGRPNVRSVNLDSELMPLEGEGKQVTVSNSAVSMGGINESATHVFWSLSDAQVRMTLDGSDPTTSKGHLLNIGANGVMSRRQFVAAKFIRTGSVDGVLYIEPMQL